MRERHRHPQGRMRLLQRLRVGRALWLKGEGGGAEGRRSMGKKDSRVDAYIVNANPFARPILKRLRKWAHQYSPECVETLKWSAPHFSYKGKMYCGMSAFKEHCAFGFWHPLMRRNDNSLEGM